MTLRDTVQRWRHAPVSVLGVATLAIFIGITLSLQLAGSVPWLGLQFEPTADGSGVVVTRVTPRGPADGMVAPGTRIQALSAAGVELEPEPGDLVEDPDFVNRYADFNRFISRQQQLSVVMAADALELTTANGETRVLHPEAQRPVGSLPLGFWFQLAFGAICLLVSAGVYAYNRSMAALLYLVSGIGLFVVGLSASIYSTRELALPGDLIHRLSLANHFGGLLFGAAYLSLMWRYPLRLSRFPFELGVFLTFSVIFVLHATQRLPGIDAGFRYPLMASLVAAVVLSGIQWRRTGGRPLDRAALRWFFLVWVTGAVLFQALLFVPLVNDHPPLLPQAILFAGLLPIFLVIPLGITRYRLFDLDRWWLAAWSWFLGGVAVLLLDLLLVSVLQVNRGAAAAASIAVIGWLYFPLREWIWTRVTRGHTQSRHDRLQQAVDLLTSEGAEVDFDARWAQALKTLFRPLQCTPTAHPPSEPRITDDGLTLEVPGVAGAPALRLQAAEEGRRLYGRDDLDVARNLCQMGTRVGLALNRLGNLNRELEDRVAEKTEALRLAYEHERIAERRAAQSEERERIYRDLHDDLGAKLLTLVCSAREAAMADLARAALEDLRDTVSIRDDKDLSAAAVLAEWRDECKERLESAEIALEWRVAATSDPVAFSADARTALGRVLREALSNAIRHARPPVIEVEPSFSGAWLQMRLRHQGHIGDPAEWRHGRGLLSMQSRLQRLGGTVSWVREGETLVTLWRCPVTPVTAD